MFPDTPWARHVWWEMWRGGHVVAAHHPSFHAQTYSAALDQCRGRRKDSPTEHKYRARWHNRCFRNPSGVNYIQDCTLERHSSLESVALSSLCEVNGRSTTDLPTHCAARPVQPHDAAPGFTYGGLTSRLRDPMSASVTDSNGRPRTDPTLRKPDK